MKKFIARPVLKYQVENERPLYTDEVKNELNKRYNEYLNGDIVLVNQEESRKRIDAMLTQNGRPPYGA